LVLTVGAWLTLGLSGTAVAEVSGEHVDSVAAPSAFMLFDAKGAAYFGACIGAGLVIMGGAKGISRIGGGAVESMARQPEAAANISVAMIITAAMIEGATLFAVVLCLLAVLLK